MRNFLLFILALVSQLGLYGQINLIGLKNAGPGLAVIRWNAITGQVLDSVQTTEVGVAVGSSAYDAQHGHYYFGGTGGLWHVDIPGAHDTLYSFMNHHQSAEYDMMSSRGFGLDPQASWDSLAMQWDYRLYLLEYTLNPPSITSLFHTDGCSGIVLDASAYNSNLGTYYCLGMDTSLGLSLYQIVQPNVNSSFVPLAVSAGNFSIQSMEYDNDNDILYAIGGQGGRLHIEQIDTSTGMLLPEAHFAQFIGYQVGSNTYHQATHSFVFSATDTSGNSGFWAYDTQLNQLTALQAPSGNILEVEADNMEYAQVKYTQSGFAPAAVPMAKVEVYPNPSSGAIAVRWSKEGGAIAKVSVLDAFGRRQELGYVTNGGSLSLEGLSAGLYHLSLAGVLGNQIAVAPIVVNR